MSETSDKISSFLNLTRQSNIDAARREAKRELKDKVPTTVAEYAKQNQISLQQARDELISKGVRLGRLQPFKDIKSGIGAVTAANYDQTQQLEVLPDGRVVSKDRPKGAAGALATLLDFTTLGFLDTDQMGGGFGGTKTGLGYKIDTGKYKQDISTKGQKALLKEAVDEKIDDTEFNVLGNVVNGSGSGTSGTSGSVQDQVTDFIRKQNELEREERRKDTLQSTALNIATTPIYTRLLEDAAKKRLELDKAMLTAREMMPSNIQNIMKSKQEQMNLAADSEYRRALGTAAQQTAANQFGAAGIQRSFGNVS